MPDETGDNTFEAPADGLDSPRFDDLLDNHLQQAGANMDDFDPRSDDRDDPPEDRRDDTRDGAPDDDDDDTDPRPRNDGWRTDHDAEDEGPEEEDEDDERDDERGDEDEGRDEDADEDGDRDPDGLDEIRLTRADREAIESDPKLKKAHRAMQRGYTKLHQEMRQEQREVQAERRQYAEFHEIQRDPQKFARYMGNIGRKYPDVGAAVLGRLATGKQKAEYLTAVALDDTKTFESVVELVEELQGSPEKMQLYKERQDVAIQRARNKADLRRMNQRRFDRQYAGIQATTERLARAAGIDKADMKFVMEQVNAEVRRATAKDGRINLEERDLRQVVRTAYGTISRWEKRWRDRQRQREVRNGQKTTRRRARTAKNRRSSTAPRSRSGRKATDKQRPIRRSKEKTQADRDRNLDRFTDQFVGGL